MHARGLVGAPLIAFLTVLGTAGVAVAQKWNVGDKVQAYDVDWYNATIAQVGSGSYQGYYLVKWDSFAGQQSIAEANIRARPGGTARTLSAGADCATGGQYAVQR